MMFELSFTGLDEAIARAEAAAARARRLACVVRFGSTEGRTAAQNAAIAGYQAQRGRNPWRIDVQQRGEAIAGLARAVRAAVRGDERAARAELEALARRVVSIFREKMEALGMRATGQLSRSMRPEVIGG